MQKNQKLNLDKELLYELYIVQEMTSQEVADVFGCTSKSVRNYLKKYGIAIRPMPAAVKLERSKWTVEQEMARTNHFISTWYKKSSEERAEITKRRHSSPNINSAESIAKAKQTRFKNNTYKKSKAEDDFYNKLRAFVRDDLIIRGYIDDRYPFNCDFYIKSMDLFIEYQGHQTHGSMPYNANDDECKREAQYLEAHGFSSSTYVIRDSNKLEIALKNKINLLLIYPKNNSYLIKDGTIKCIGKFDVTKINDLC